MKRITILGFGFFAILAQCIAVNIKQFNSVIPQTHSNSFGSRNSSSAIQCSSKQFKARKSHKKAENRARNQQH